MGTMFEKMIVSDSFERTKSETPIIAAETEYDETAPSPREYGIPHDRWRKGQWQTVEFVRDEDAPVSVVEQPTGSGKSAVAKALSSSTLWQSTKTRAVVLTRTKALQDQYGGEYLAHLMKGKSNYKCVHDKAERWQTADDCLFAERGMSKCEFREDCPYLQAKRLALLEPFVCTNYAYWLSAIQLKEEMRNATEKGFRRVLVCDEGHLLSNITLSWAGLSVNINDKIKYGLPMFPIIKGNTIGVSTMSQMFNTSVPETSSNTDKVLSWLSASTAILEAKLKNAVKQAEIEEPTEDERKEIKALEHFTRKLSSTFEAITHSEEDWFIRSGPGQVYYRGDKIAGMIIKPLTARHQFKRLFLGSTRTLLMSATIGDPETYSQELGLGDDFVFRSVENQFPPDARPVHVLNAPRMSHRSQSKDYDAQADVIAAAINAADPMWSGIIHVTRKKAAEEMAQRLARRGLQDRIWVPPQKKRNRWLGTTEQLQEWEKRKLYKPNSIMIAWQFWEGFDGRDERICIVAKVPFPYLGDEYERARKNYSGSFFLQRSGWDFAQGLGRTRRGRTLDYDTGGQVRGLVAIADGNWTRIKKYIPNDIIESLVLP